MYTRRFPSGVSLIGKFDGELASRASTYSGTGSSLPWGETDQTLPLRLVRGTLRRRPSRAAIPIRVSRPVNFGWSSGVSALPRSARLASQRSRFGEIPPFCDSDHRRGVGSV